jgi:hypothetical protein
MTLSSGPLAIDRSQFRTAERDRHCEKEQPSGYVTAVEIELTIRPGAGLSAPGHASPGQEEPDSSQREDPRI